MSGDTSSVRGGLQAGCLAIRLLCRGGLQARCLPIGLLCRGGLQARCLPIGLLCGGGLQAGCLAIRLLCRGGLQAGCLAIRLLCRRGLQAGCLPIRLLCERSLRFFLRLQAVPCKRVSRMDYVGAPALSCRFNRDAITGAPFASYLSDGVPRALCLWTPQFVKLAEWSLPATERLS